MSTDDRDWIRAGAKVAEVLPSRGRGASGIHPATVQAVRRGYAILDSGRSYDVKTLLPKKGNQGMGASYMVLRAMGDPEVCRSLALKALDAVAITASQAYRDGADNATEVLAALESIERCLAEARTQVVALADADMDRATNIAKEA